MTTTYTTREGDAVDYIAWRYYGTRAGLATEQLLAANPGLATRGSVLPAGVVITLPAIDTTETSAGVKLWD